MHSTKVEIIWTIVPVVILVVMAIPAAELILKMEDMRNSELSIRVTGYQWKWEYQYMDAGEGIDILLDAKAETRISRASCIRASTRIRCRNYLLEVDHPLVVPSGTKVRVLLTSQRCDSRLVRARFRPKALGGPGLHQRAVVQGRPRQGRDLSRPVRSTLRPRSRIHARGRRRSNAGRFQEVGRGAEGAAQAGGRRDAGCAPLGPSPDIRTEDATTY